MTVNSPSTGDTLPPQGDRWDSLTKDELYWCDRQPWLEEHGYMLRPRYRPGWKPFEGETTKFREDSHWSLVRSSLVESMSQVSSIMDATRLSDGYLVTMKKIEIDIHPYELEIGQFLSSDQITFGPRNRCVRILEVLPDPTEKNISIIVMPYLKAFNDPDFLTFGEAVTCLKQLIEGLRVMHENHVAHRYDYCFDISDMNIMMDAAVMYPGMWHPHDPRYKYDHSGWATHYSRTERPPKYYYIDFGLSRKYDPTDGPPKELPILGGDKSVPEFRGEGYDKPSIVPILSIRTFTTLVISCEPSS
ncbi:uncharacterized protein B0H18DRAFT_1025314 [Fomitopsis serialis]|uniref:uncharacterized protein n=1 Tax=Fomitopsis serialis TaxID=139415 RepID=UPI0020083D5D|nr:uncharacterized protein B0H18DRAFT_1025314 [Neoantrodia serialis]KAH9920144.1 hypothetical protein B0H18DRAFT_1025314 [Neoantrodia serialis]